MKKFYLFSLCIILSTLTSAQIILIDQVVFEPEDNISVVFTDDAASEGGEGENVIWDFSDESGGDTVTWIGVDPADHNVAQELWPGSDLGSFIPSPLNDTFQTKTYEFYDFQSDRIATLGAYSILKNLITNEADTQIINYAGDPFEEFQFPMSYFDEFESDYSGTISGSFAGIETNIKRGGTVIMKADATGTIHTPVGSFSNVLRVKRTETQNDTSIFNVGGQMIESVTKTETTLFDWFQPERKYTIYRHFYSTITYPGLPPQALPPGSFYTIENGVSDVKDNEIKPDISLYPNPTQDILTIENFTALYINQIEIYGPTGKREKLITNPSETITLSDIPSGNYILRLVTKQGNFKQRFVKI